MSRTWIRRSPEPRESLTAGLLAVTTAAAVGVVTWYVTRTLLSREPISLRPEDGRRPIPSPPPRELE